MSDSLGLRTIRSGLNNTGYHDYVLTGTVGATGTWTLSYDNIVTASGSCRQYDPSSNQLVLGDQSAGANAKAEVTKYTFTQSGPPEATDNVSVRVDDGRGGFDTQSFTITVASQPNVDLAVPEVDPDALVFDGQQLTVSGAIVATIKNLGSQSVLDPFDVLFFEDRNDNSVFDAGVDNVLGTKSVTVPLAAGATAIVSATLNGLVLFSGNRIWAFVDSGQAVRETDETNNLGVHFCEYVPQLGGVRTLG